MRYLTSDTNAIADATLTATNVIASQAFEQTLRDAVGGGNITLTGSYTGADDAVFDLEILSNTINGAPSISAPVFSGVGNGTISSVAATSALAAQEFTITCLDLGTETRKAWAPFQSVNLRAKVAGPSGNDISLRISQAGLTATATDFAVTSELTAGGTDFAGEQFNFGGPTLEPEGTVPVDAPRLRFGDDVTVYRHWKSYKAGRYTYHFSPAIARTVPIGTRVYTITGGRSVTVYDGPTLTDTHSNITTLYSLLTAIESASTLIEVDGVIANDRRPRGMACDDLSVFTASYSAGSTRDGTRYIKRAIIPLTVSGSAPSETLRIECLAAPIPGAEIWGVTGAVSGALANAISGELYSAGGYSFTIPIELQPGAEPEGDRSAELELLQRGAGERIPTLCTRNFRLGAEAQSRTYTFEWRPHPGEECPCDTVQVSGGPNDVFLGITDTGGEALATLPPAVKNLYTNIALWRKSSIAINCYFGVTDTDPRTAPYYGGINIISTADVTASASVTDAVVSQGIASGLVEAASAVALFDEQDIRAITMTADFLQAHLLAIYDGMGGSGDFDAAVSAVFESEFDEIVSLLTPLSLVTTTGATSWKRTGIGIWQLHDPDVDFLTVLTRAQDAAAGARQLTQNLGPLMRRLEAGIANAYIEADLLPPFDSAGRTGNAVWQDHGGSHWFVSLDGLLPLQPGFYYHSARMETDPETEEQTPVATREWGMGAAIGCLDALKVGDKLIVKTSPFANGRATYQQADYVEFTIQRADPVALGGGQTGDDTLTFTVRGSVVGPLANYALVTTSTAGYSNGGLSFAITPGGIRFEVGDNWTFSAEGGEFRWRQDGGSWSADTDIASTVTLSDGVSARFTTGETPSFVGGDSYTLTAFASNGVGQARTPGDGALSWAGSLQLDVTPAGSAPVACLLLAQHTIPSTATITLSASDDNWSTVAFSAAIPWAKGAIGYLLPATETRQKWRLEVDASGSIGWPYLGAGVQLLIPNGRVEQGIWNQRVSPATSTRSRSIGGDISHTAVTQDSFDTLLESLEHSLTNDDGRIGLVSSAGDGAFARIDGDTLPLTDPVGFRSAERRFISVTIPIVPL